MKFITLQNSPCELITSVEYRLVIALMHVYVRLANYTTKPRFRSVNL